MILKALYCILCCAALYYSIMKIALYDSDSIVLYCTVLYCTVLYCTALRCTALYCTILCYAVLGFIELSYAVPYSTFLYVLTILTNSPIFSQDYILNYLSGLSNYPHLYHYYLYYYFDYLMYNYSDQSPWTFDSRMKKNRNRC